ncbi:hypothetical protein MATL_G00145300 [Megalops atlanticus]|uniref:CENP-T/Histone H4 histone fold domain-containing protein n=1 Tax=Megalops atlanticus TaxID=7932 RepID=A0A9D3T3B3_MEGAT|nr:hypothetical protein MATL_G00145300 [Megalops atlanticus]
MDSLDEDVSARVLLRHVLHAEMPASPVTRRASRAQRESSGPRRSARLRKSDAALLSPQTALRHKLKQNMRESFSSRSTLQPRRSSLSTLSGKVNAPAATPSLPVDDEDLTARVLLRGILRTEPETSLLVPDRHRKMEGEPVSTESSLCSNRPSIGTSDLDLPDLPTVNLTMAVRGISRKRPKRNFNVSVFERKIDQVDDEQGDQDRDATENLSAMSGVSASSLTLSLKTPHDDPHTDRQALQRRARKRKVISVEAFEEGVHNHLARKRVPDGEQSLSEPLGETGVMEKFTLDLSDTTGSDVVMSDTALYPQPVSMAMTPHAISASASVSIADKDTVTATQIQREVEERAGPTGWSAQEEEVMEEGGETQAGRMDEGVTAGEKDADEEEEEMEAQEEGAGSLPGKAAVDLPEEARTEEGNEMMEGEREEEEEEEEGDGVGCDGNDNDPGLENTEDQNEETSAEPEREEEEAVQSEREEEEAVESEREEAVESEREEEEEAVESEREEEEEAVESKREEQEEAVESEKEEEEAVESGKEEEALGESEVQEEEEQEPEMQEEEVTSEEQVRIMEHISRRAYRSEGVMKIPGMAGGRGYKSLSHGLQVEDTESDGAVEGAESGRVSEGGASAGWSSGLEEGSQVVQNLPSISSSPNPPSPAGSPSEVPPSPQPLYASRGRSQREAEEPVDGASISEEVVEQEGLIAQAGSPEISPVRPQTPHTSVQAEPHAGDQGEGSLEEEEEEDGDDGCESEELSMKTPAFVRERRRVQTPGPLATPDILKQMMEGRALPQTAPATKPKPQRKQRPAPSGDPGLPKSYIMSVFKHFAKTKVSGEVYPVLKEIMDRYFDRLADDLEAYAAHARRKTIEVEDVELLMRRQGFVTDTMPVNVLIEKYLPLEYRKLLIPVATSGNKVIPKQRR